MPSSNAHNTEHDVYFKFLVSIDFENGFLKANYHGESGFFICSYKWFQIYSFTICNELQR